jgi:hypothetical protein
MLNVDDANDFVLADNRNRQKGLITVFGQAMKNLEAWIVERVTLNGDGCFSLATQPVIPSPILILMRPMIRGCGFLEARSTSSSLVGQQVQQACISAADLTTSSIMWRSTSSSSGSAHCFTDAVKDLKLLILQLKAVFSFVTASGNGTGKLSRVPNSRLLRRKGLQLGEIS